MNQSVCRCVRTFSVAGAHGCVLSTDDYFISPNGEYRFDRNLLTEAHAWNRSRAERALKEGTSCMCEERRCVRTADDIGCLCQISLIMSVIETFFPMHNLVLFAFSIKTYASTLNTVILSPLLSNKLADLKNVKWI